jgi:hypothetical protein
MAQHRVIYKSTSIEFLDDFYRKNVTDAVAFGQGALSNPNSDAMSVAQDWAATADFDTGELAGFGTHWLGQNSALSAHDVDRVLRLAYREALELAASHDPVQAIETFWVRGAGDDFEVHIHEGVERITMFMFIPVVRRYGSWRAGTRSHVVRVGDLDDVHHDAPRRELDGGDEPVMMIQVSGEVGDTA